MTEISRISILTQPVNERDHRLGPDNAPVTLVEFGDYECPYCAMAYPTTMELKRRLGDRLCFVYRHFPLIQIHPHSEHAAEAAEAAGAQGKFWEIHGLLFEHQKELDDPHLVRYAAELGLERARFMREMAAHMYADRVLENLLSGTRSGVAGTPTFFINGLRYEGSYDLVFLLAALESAMIAA